MWLVENVGRAAVGSKGERELGVRNRAERKRLVARGLFYCVDAAVQEAAGRPADGLRRPPAQAQQRDPAKVGDEIADCIERLSVGSCDQIGRMAQRLPAERARTNDVTGARVVSTPGAALLELVDKRRARQVELTVSPPKR